MSKKNKSWYTEIEPDGTKVRHEVSKDNIEKGIGEIIVEIIGKIFGNK